MARVLERYKEYNVYPSPRNLWYVVEHQAWAYGKGKIRGAERNMPDFFKKIAYFPQHWQNFPQNWQNLSHLFL
jgi:hypothetical protein